MTTFPGTLSQNTGLHQQIRLSSQLMQRINVLQMTSQELASYLDELSLENPVVESDDSHMEQYKVLRSQTFNSHSTNQAGADTVQPEHGITNDYASDLNSFLKDQFSRLHLDKRMYTLCCYLCDLLDEYGYLPQEDWDRLLSLGLPAEMTAQALEYLQALDPPGVGARDLSESLLLQLHRKGVDDPVVYTVVSNHLPELGQRHFGAIAKKLGVQVSAVIAAGKVISSLEPYPYRQEEDHGITEYAIPDVFVREVDGILSVDLNESYLPRITVSDYYIRLLHDTDDPQVKEYLHNKVHQAQWVVDSLQRRGLTLLRITEAVTRIQEPFFLNKTSTLTSISLTDMAEELGLHPSTISRAIRGKYVECSQGCFSLRYFFQRALGTQEPSVHGAKQQIAALIAGENKAHPLSDQKICDTLQRAGITLARRTVAKYREELHIPPASARKERT